MAETTAEGQRPQLVAVLARAIHAEPEELLAALLAFVYFFSLLAGYSVLRPIRDQLGAATGVEKLPWLFSGTFAAMLLCVPAFGALAARLPRRRLVPITNRFFAFLTLAFWLSFVRGWAPGFSVPAFFIWVSVYNLFVVSVFWSLMADLFTHEQGTRLFGFIAAGGTTGALVGPVLIELLVRRIGTAHLLLISAALLEVAVWCVHGLHRWTLRHHGQRQRSAEEQPLGGGVFDGVRVVFRSPFLLALCGYILLFTATQTFLYFEQVQIVARAATDAKTRTLFFARIDLAVHVTTLIVQAFVTSRVVKRLGVRFGIGFLPVITAICFVALALAPTLVVIAVVQGLRRAAHYGLERPAREVLFTVIPREQKYKSKNFIDTVVYRGGDALSAWASQAFASFGLGAVAVGSVALCGVWLWNSLFLARRDEERA